MPAAIALLAAGCNAVFGLEPVSGGPDAAPDAPAPTAAGRVQAVSHDHQSTAGDVLSYTLDAEFGPPSRACHEQSRVGGCLTAICTTEAPIARSHAGVIGFEGALTASLAPGADGVYPTVSRSGSRLFTTPGTLRVSAPGDDVPAFDVTMPTPLSVVFDNPMPSPTGPPLIVSRATNLVLSWTGGDAGRVSFGLSTAGTPVVVICSFLVSEGTGTVDQTLLAALPMGTGSLGSAVTAVENLIAGTYAIQVSATVVGKRTDGARAAGPITLE